MAGVKDKVALVTGCGSAGGIGFACAGLLKRAGAKVAITSTTDRIVERAGELGDGVFAHACDLTDVAQVDELVTATQAALGPVDIVVNNAGMVQIGHDEPSRLIQDIPDEQWRRGMDINLTTVFNVTRRVVPSMIERRYGRIVNMSSVTGPLVSNPKGTIYSAAKAAIMGMTRAQAIELAEYNITVNGIGPGWIETPSSSPEEIFAGGQAPIGRPGTADEIGQVALFLASEEASFVTGQLIVADGGNTLMEYKGPSEGYY
ncbi:MAG: SDR family NAD(P)-dependent oxidoreductase [Anderseniella sp.]